jgi:hypothetical protein
VFEFWGRFRVPGFCVSGSWFLASVFLVPGFYLSFLAFTLRVVISGSWVYTLDLVVRSAGESFPLCSAGRDCRVWMCEV